VEEVLAEASGSPMEAGKPVVWQDEVPGACYQKTVIRVRPFSKEAATVSAVSTTSVPTSMTPSTTSLSPARAGTAGSPFAQVEEVLLHVADQDRGALGVVL